MLRTARIEVPIKTILPAGRRGFETNRIVSELEFYGIRQGIHLKLRESLAAAFSKSIRLPLRGKRSVDATKGTKAAMQGSEYNTLLVMRK